MGSKDNRNLRQVSSILLRPLCCIIQGSHCSYISYIFLYFFHSYIFIYYFKFLYFPIFLKNYQFYVFYINIEWKEVIGRGSDDVISLTFGDLKWSDQGHLLENRVSVQDSTIHYITLSSFHTPFTPKVTTGASTKLQGSNCSYISYIFLYFFFIPIFSYIILNSYIFLYSWKTINFTRFMSQKSLVWSHANIVSFHKFLEYKEIILSDSIYWMLSLC